MAIGLPLLRAELLKTLPAGDEVRLYVPWWWLPAKVAARAWVRGRADRRIHADLVLRRFAGRAAARRLPADVGAVYAPSFAARAVFAAAGARSDVVRCVLVEDIVDLRDLHDDLDRAASAHPDARFLRRHRASPRIVAHQQAERVLADEVLVRGAWARRQRLARGLSAEVLTRSVAAATRHAVGDPMVLLLAGAGAARSGSYEAIAAARALGARLLIRAGEGLEPADAFGRDGIERWDGDLAGVDVVVAPAWCESYPSEVPRAVVLGIPVVATARAAGALDLGEFGAEVEPGDVEGIVAAVRHLVGAEVPRE